MVVMYVHEISGNEKDFCGNFQIKYTPSICLTLSQSIRMMTASELPIPQVNYKFTITSYSLAMTLQTDSQPTAGLATITAIAAIGNPRNVAGKKFILDAQIYVGSKKCESLIGALSYYNISNIPFDHEKVALFFIYSTVSV